MFTKYMLYELHSDLWSEILAYCDNETIHTARLISKTFYNIIYSSYFQTYLQYRYHPLTFNILDNYCTICNIGIIILDEDLEIGHCQHS